LDSAVDDAEVSAIRHTLLSSPGVKRGHDIRNRGLGDMVLVDVHIKLDAELSAEAGHALAVDARPRVPQRHRVLNRVTLVDPWHRPALDHPGQAVPMD
jgi:divalent metal cation (Fe/Co/Zn/Cd) transporter